VVSREITLKIVGVCDLDPDSMRGQARARIFMPLKLAQDLHVMQPSDLRDTTNMASGAPAYMTVEVHVKSPTQVQAVEDAIKKMGFNTFSIVDATRSLRQFFAVLDLVSRNLRQPRVSCCFNRNHQHASHGDSRTSP
jgi:NAD-dependent oxidoreductase involved in siderophore biosynthesis